MNNLIPKDVRDVTLSLQLRIFLGQEMRTCKLRKPKDRYDYKFIKKVNRDLIDGKVHPDVAIDLIWGWVVNGGDETTFDSIGLWDLARKYELTLKRN